MPLSFYPDFLKAVHNEEYISSGILELYAAGGLTPQEREEVERRAAASPEIRLALDEACAAMEGYARLHAVTPRPELKSTVLQRIEASPSTTGIAENTAEEETPVLPLGPAYTKEASPYKWMFAASIVLFLISGLLSFHFYNKWQQAEERLANVVASEQLLARNFRNTSLQVQQQEKTLAILRNPDFKPVRLQGVETHPDASLTVYWNARRQQVYVDQVALPKPPTGKQYQLWALADGKPVDAGMIELTTESLQEMKKIGTAQAFAVTLEPIGGSKEPTLEALTVVGNVGS